MYFYLPPVPLIFPFCYPFYPPSPYITSLFVHPCPIYSSFALPFTSLSTPSLTATLCTLFPFTVSLCITLFIFSLPVCLPFFIYLFPLYPFLALPFSFSVSLHIFPFLLPSLRIPFWLPLFFILFSYKRSCNNFFSAFILNFCCPLNLLFFPPSFFLSLLSKRPGNTNTNFLFPQHNNP